MNNCDNESAALEQAAVDLYKKYRWALPAPVKSFFQRLADFLNWEQLKKEM